MRKLKEITSYAVIVCMLALFASCKDNDNLVTEFGCGEVETKIAELDVHTGSYIDSVFTRDSSSIFDVAAISITIDEVSGEPNCFAFTPIPQTIESISITSSVALVSGGVEFALGENLNDLFKIYSNETPFSVSEYINAQALDPLIFHTENDNIIFQLLNKPDVAINQPFQLMMSFDDSEILNADIPNFEVGN